MATTVQAGLLANIIFGGLLKNAVGGILNWLFWVLYVEKPIPVV